MVLSIFMWPTIASKTSRSSQTPHSLGGKLTVPSWQKTRLTIDEQTGRSSVRRTRHAYHLRCAGRFTAVPWINGAFLDADGQPLKAPPLEWFGGYLRDLDGDGARTFSLQ